MVKVLDFTKPHVLRDEDEYTAAIAEIERLLDADPSPGSEEYERLEFLSVLVQAYEEAHVPVPELPTPQEVVDFMLDQKGLTRADIAKWLRGKRQMADFFSGRCRLSLRQIDVLREQLGIPADLLISRISRSR